MKCKNCGAQVQEDERYCAACGEAVDKPAQQSGVSTEEERSAFIAPPPVTKRSKVPVVIASVLLVGAIVAGLVLSGVFSADTAPEGDDLSMSDPAEPTTTSVGGEGEGSESTIPLELGPERGGDEIAAQMSDYQLDNSTLGFYYWEEGNNLINTYGAYGLFDATMAFSLQEYPYEDYATWHDMLVDMAVDRWATYTIMFDKAQAENHQMSETYSDYLANVPDYVEADAQAQGMEVDAFLERQYGKFANLEGFLAYMEKYCLVSSYINEQYEAMLAPYTQNLEMTESVNVRHILFTTGTEDDEAVKVEAQRVYQLFLDNPTEDNFSQLATEYTADGNGSVGGIYKGVYPGQMVETFNDWCFDSSRQPGDHGIVETDYGFHLMYFVGTTGELVAADAQASAQAEEQADAEFDTWLEEQLATMDYTINQENVYQW